MRLKDLETFSTITIQCHDNPDADALASGFGLYCYFQSKGIETRLIYSGRNQIQKSNLKLMIEELQLPVEYWKPVHRGVLRVEGLLITVDCQYSAGNVTLLDADAVAVIDHHQVEVEGIPLSRIYPGLGSCATLVWSMLKEEMYAITDIRLGTALFYGLYTDTNQFSEVYNPLDMDMWESVSYNKSLIARFRNSNLSLQELEIAGIAMLRYSYNEDYHFAVIKSHPCDPNILGLISDFLLQVDAVDTCVVYNQNNEGYKYSVRSCIKEVNANELADYLAEGIGSGGGHREKAGGFISRKLYDETYPTLHSEGYFNNRMTGYFDSYDIIYGTEYKADVSAMRHYKRKLLPEGCVRISQVFPVGTPITIRTMQGDIGMTADEDSYVVLGKKGEVHTYSGEQFRRSYEDTGQKYFRGNGCAKEEYVPILKNQIDGSTHVIADCASICLPSGDMRVYAHPLKKAVKVFTKWDGEQYILGKAGDYLTVRCDDLHDVSIVAKEIFESDYEEIDAE